jgi:HD-GYP domain-containing protein (c-di-GMP phosphodiesterase class II)
VLSTHPQVGYDILENIDFSWPIAEIVLQHHEKLDGSGYPRRLKGKEILLEARILCVADVVEAMGSHRPYRASLGIERALEEISQHKGIFYDTEVVDICAELFAHEAFEFDPSTLESTPLHHL